MIRTLEIASLFLCIACECHFWALLSQKSGDLLVGNVADLMILVDNLAVGVADAAITSRGHDIADFVGCAHVAVDTGPAVVAFAVAATTLWPILALRQRATHCSQSVSSVKGVMGGARGVARGLRQSSPPKPGGQSHLPLNSLQPEYWVQWWAGRRQLKL